MAIPEDFLDMTAQEQIAWVTANDDGSNLLELVQRLGVRQEREPQVPESQKQSITVRMPKELISRIDSSVGDNIEGRSGLVRAAVQSYLDQLDQLKAGPEPLVRQEATR